MSTMPLVNIASNEFINTDHVVTVFYKPAETRARDVNDVTDYSLSKKVATPSFVKVVLSNGETIERKGEDANVLFTTLTGQEP
jgi:hypothetical protein